MSKGVIYHGHLGGGGFYFCKPADFEILAGIPDSDEIKVSRSMYFSFQESRFCFSRFQYTSTKLLVKLKCGRLEAGGCELLEPNKGEQTVESCSAHTVALNEGCSSVCVGAIIKEYSSAERGYFTTKYGGTSAVWGPKSHYTSSNFTTKMTKPIQTSCGLKFRYDITEPGVILGGLKSLLDSLPHGHLIVCKQPIHQKIYRLEPDTRPKILDSGPMISQHG